MSNLSLIIEAIGIESASVANFNTRDDSSPIPTDLVFFTLLTIFITSKGVICFTTNWVLGYSLLSTLVFKGNKNWLSSTLFTSEYEEILTKCLFKESTIFCLLLTCFSFQL